MSPPFRSLARSARILRLALPLALLAGCAAHPPPGSLPAPSPPAADPAPATPPLGSGWTVRLHSGEDPAEAEEIASRAVDRFDEPVSVVDRAGEYQVQLGGFATEADARAFLAVARERGFPEASVQPNPAPATPSDPSARGS